MTDESRIVLVILGDTTDFVHWATAEELARMSAAGAICLVPDNLQETDVAAAIDTMREVVSDCHFGMLDLESDRLDRLLDNPYFHETERERCIYKLERDDIAIPEQPFIPQKKHHGQPRSLKETRRSQRKGGRR